MKLYKTTIELELLWNFDESGLMFRSNVVGGYQAEIFKGVLRIVGSSGAILHKSRVDRRAYGMQKASKIIRDLIQGAYESG